MAIKKEKVVFTSAQIFELIEFLTGSCDTLDEGISSVLGEDYSESDLSKSNLEQIDGEIFLCDLCGWWYEVEEKTEHHGDAVCESCSND